MGLLNFLTGPSRQEQAAAEKARILQEKNLSDIKASIRVNAEKQKALEEEIRTRRRTLQRPIQYATHDTDSGSRGGIFYGPLHDLGEIGRSLDVEPYIRVSVRKHREQILKEGWELRGEDPEMVEYIKQRLFEMTLVSGITTEQWLRDFVTQLVTYATSFLVIKRSSQKSSGNAIRMHGKTLEPIAAVFPMDPSSVKGKQNKHGHPTKWLQKVSQAVGEKSKVEFNVEDVVVATIDKKTGFVFGTPYILPTLDDVRALRRLEEIAEMVAQSHAWPLTHWQVGEKDDPPAIFDDGTSEIDLVRSEIEGAPTEGGIVTSHRVMPNVLGMNGEALDIEPYIKHFESRVMAGLRLSPEDLGRSEGSKASAATVSQSLQDSSKDMQSVISDVLSWKLFFPLLLEGGFNVTKDNVVKLVFPLINREEDRARQSHGNDLYLAGSITRSEYRKEWLNKEPLTDEESDDCIPEQKHEFDMELANVAAAAKAATQAASANKAATNKSNNTTRPKNQSGQKATKTRVKANDASRIMYSKLLLDGFESTSGSLRAFVSKHEGGVSDEGSDAYDLTTKDDELKSILEYFVTFSTAAARQLLDAIIVKGAKTSLSDMQLEIDYELPNKLFDRFYKNTIHKTLKQFTQYLYNTINSNEKLASDADTNILLSEISNIMDFYKTELEVLVDKHVDLAYRFGFARTAKVHGEGVIVLTPNSEQACDVCLHAGAKHVSLTSKDIPYKILLDTHSGCEYQISLPQKNLQSE
jgi:hypothetical protein